MRALITGASSGIGKDMALNLAERGYDLILIARRLDKLEELKNQITNVNVKIISLDLSNSESCIALYNSLKDEPIDILINNAGFGLYGNFFETELEKELSMINTNITSLHILTKLFLKDFIKRDSGCILNVASSAAFLMGPKMAAYYATKNYVLRLSEAIYEELRRKKSNVSISVLCPGPVATEFNEVANVSFSMKPLSSKYVADYAIRKALKKKLIIVPGVIMKITRFFEKFASEKLLARICYNIQDKKKN